MAGEWIGVAEVAAEMGLTDRAAWELVKRIGCPAVEGERATARNARFLRADFDAARERSKGPAPARAAYTRKPSAGTPPADANPARAKPATPSASAQAAALAESKRAKIRAM